MVSLTEVRASNARVTSSVPSGPVAVFVGGTSGIGETTLKQFAKSARKPRVYLIGRSQEAGARIVAECRAISNGGEFTFIKADISLIRNVDQVCQDIKSKEKTINLLFLSQGTLDTSSKTSEGLRLNMALIYYSRLRFIINFLPLIRKAKGLRRVVSVGAGTKEGPIDTSDFQGWNLSVLKYRGHLVSMKALALEAMATKAPEVSFVHAYPGVVRTNIGRDAPGILFFLIKWVLPLIGAFVYVPVTESGERHLFLATSERYPSGVVSATDTTMPWMDDGAQVAMGTTGESGSGVYSVDRNGESAGPKVVKLLGTFRRDGVGEKVWKHTETEFARIVAI